MIESMTMTSTTLCRLAMLALVLPQPVLAQSTSVAPKAMPSVAERYALADKFLAPAFDTLIADAMPRPQFTFDSKGVLYRAGTVGARIFTYYDLASGTSRRIIDEGALAAQLARATGKEVDPKQMVLDGLDYSGGTLAFDFVGRRWTLGGDGQVVAAPVGPPQGTGAISPDGRFEVLARHDNLVARDRKSGREVALTSDGTPEQSYGLTIPQLSDILEQGTEDPKRPVQVRWSPDSRYVVTWRLDTRGVVPLTITQENPPGSFYPRSFRYIYPLAGAEKVPLSTLYTVNVEDALKRRRARPVPIQVPPEARLYPDEIDSYWLGGRLRFQRTERGYSKIESFSADPDTGVATLLAREAVKPLVTVTATAFRGAPDLGGELIVSERSGWAQLYLVQPDDPDGGHALTRGDWEVTGIVDYRPQEKTLLLTGIGREPDRNPYYRQLYRVVLDGSQPVLLTPEPLDHVTSISFDGRYVLDSMSSPTDPTVTVIRSAVDGHILTTLAKADARPLFASGFVPPEPFTGVAADGHTRLYGMIWRPANFDPNRRYPVIDYVYTGPTTHVVPQDWTSAVRLNTNSVAQLGAIVVAIDGRGTSQRGQAFRLPAYQNLGEVGIDDHVAMMRQMAARYPYMDLDRVGVYGFSAGGYDAARFILRRPAFFKVSVAGAGNHDLRLDKAWWPEVSMGLASPDIWERNSNMAVAGNLVGKLLLVHGDIDDNVPVTESFRLANTLIAKGRDVDVVILPNTRHFVYQPFFWRKLRDYFVRNLMDENPPPLPLPSGKGMDPVAPDPKPQPTIAVPAARR